ncbi:MAG: carboxypeptidase regulatory-like domain-containing protein [Thermoanaerobaculia bacterium]|nr:carboxypeptidase regulatory-like domain-containing protein [Thermoanaerobaculia bacterium]
MTKNHLFSLLALLLVLPLAVGCGGGDGAPETEAPAPAAEPAQGGSGSIAGAVTYSNGDPDQPIAMDADPKCAEMHADPVYTQKIVAGDDGGLANAFVYISSGLEGKKFPAPGEPHVLDQKGCQYTPHVSGMMTGQTLIIRNSDETLHNVHARPANNPEFNQGQPFQGMELERTFSKAEVMIPFKCDVHPWMASYMAALDHPFFAVTGEDGSFSIEGVPAGSYTLEVWHEELGTQTQQVEVADGAAVEANWSFGGGDAASGL